MVQLFIYLVSAGLVVLGSLGFIAALSIPGRIRSFLACLAACVPVVVGVWLFRSSDLRLEDIGSLVRDSARDVQQTMQGLKETRDIKKQLGDLLR